MCIYTNTHRQKEDVQYNLHCVNYNTQEKFKRLKKQQSEKKCVVVLLNILSTSVSLPRSFRPRAPERLAGPTRTTLPSVRPAWTSLPAGLAQCHWSTHRWGWTLSSLKTKCPYWGRNTGTSRGYNLSWPRPSLRLFGHERKAEQGGGGGWKLQTSSLSLTVQTIRRRGEMNC